jgi:hypothetical protein
VGLRREVGEGEKNHAIDGLFQAAISFAGAGLYIFPTPTITGEDAAAPVATVVEVVTWPPTEESSCP